MSNIKGEICEFRLGLPGKGKTLTQTELVVIPALVAGLDVYCNYWVNWTGDNFHYFNDFNDVKNIRNAVVVFDEIGTILDPRNWDNEDSGVRTFFQQHRKRHIDIYGTTQHISLIAKTALIEVDRFLMCTKNDPGFLNWLFPNFPLVIHEQEMSLKEIKLEDSDFQPAYSETEDFSFGSNLSHWFKKNTLLHRELDDFKEELIFHSCPDCCQRQDPKILKQDTEKFAEFDSKKSRWRARPDRERFFCPKHRDTELEIHESSMYDTDYEIIVPKKKVRAVLMVESTKWVPHRGSLTPEQASAVRALESH